MKTFRTVLFWCHLVAGVTAGLVILMMSITGALLTYQRQIVAWAERDIRSIQTDGHRLPLDAIVAGASQARPDVTITSIMWRADPTAPVALTIGPRRVLFVDAYSGRLLGEGSRGLRDFFQRLTEWHRWFGASAERRTTARWVTGAANLAFLFLVISGPYLWWPRKWSRQSVAAITRFDFTLRGKARDWNWHNVVGIWSAVPLFFIVASGVVMSYPWANDLVFRLTGNAPPTRVAEAAAPPRGRGEQPSLKDNLKDLGDLCARAEGQVVGWQNITVRVPESPDAPLAFTIDRGDGPRPDLRAQLILSRPTGDLLRWEPYASQNGGRQARAWLRWIHTGEAGGLAGQTVAGLASAGGALLACTGLMLAWRRFFSRSRRPTTFTAAALGDSDRKSTAA